MSILLCANRLIAMYAFPSLYKEKSGRRSIRLRVPFWPEPERNERSVLSQRSADLAGPAEHEVPVLDLRAGGGVVADRGDRGRVGRGAVDRAAAVGDEQASGGDAAGGEGALAGAAELTLAEDALALAHAVAVRADARGREQDGGGAGALNEEAGRVVGGARVHDVVQFDGRAAGVEGVAPGGARLAVTDVRHAGVVHADVLDQSGRTVRRERRGGDGLASSAVQRRIAAVTDDLRGHEAAGGDASVDVQRGVRDQIAIGVVAQIAIGDRADGAVALRREGRRGRIAARGVEAEGAVAVPGTADRGRLRGRGRSHGESGESDCAEDHLLHGGYSLFCQFETGALRSGPSQVSPLRKSHFGTLT